MNLIGLRSLLGPPGLLVSGYILLGPPGVEVVLLDLLVVRDVLLDPLVAWNVDQHLLVRT